MDIGALLSMLGSSGGGNVAGADMFGQGGGAGMGPMAGILSGQGIPPQLMAQLMPLLAQAGQGQQQPMPGQLPIAGAMSGMAGAGSPMPGMSNSTLSSMMASPMPMQRGYMAQGGGIAPRQILSR